MIDKLEPPSKRLQELLPPCDPPPSDWDMHARISVLEQQILDIKENTMLALAAADKAIENSIMISKKAVEKAELAAEKTYLEASIFALKEFVDQQVGHTKSMTEQALSSADKAVNKAEVAAEKRFESVNEFRATLSDQQRELATKSEVNLRFKALEDRVNDVVEDARELKGRSLGGRETSTDNRALLFSTIAVIVGITAIVIPIIIRFVR